jgi:hypothetical protein
MQPVALPARLLGAVHGLVGQGDEAIGFAALGGAKGNLISKLLQLHAATALDVARRKRRR